MVTIKAYTDLSQSKILSKILPLESADAFYPWRELMKDYDSIYVPEKMLMSDIEEDDILAWSLAALRNLLPAGIKISENTYLFESHNTFDKSWGYRYYNEDDTSYLYCKNVNEVDACVAMIEKLHELNLL